jgi:hypothetical protein
MMTDGSPNHRRTSDIHLPSVSPTTFPSSVQQLPPAIGELFAGLRALAFVYDSHVRGIGYRQEWQERASRSILEVRAQSAMRNGI